MKNQDLTNFANALLSAPAVRWNDTGEPAQPAVVTAAAALAAKVDELGELRAQIADLVDRAEQIRADLENAGLPIIDGHNYRASLTTVKGRTLTNWEAIAKRFDPSPQLIRAHTKTGKESTRLNMTARKITH